MAELTFDRFLREVGTALDLDWRKYRRRSARHRVEARMRELGLPGYGEFLDLLRSSTEEAGGLPDLMRVTVSRFFRERHEWEALKDNILPGLLAELPRPGVLRAWSAGCCGGEEPFTLALLWLQYLAPLHPGRTLDILATDIDQASLERGRQAVYRKESLREAPAEIRDRWFDPENGQLRVRDAARSLVRFENRNLLTDPPPQAIDLALCRYLPFTYYRERRSQAAALKLWEALRPRGVLMIGAKEVFPSSASNLFEPVAGTRVFFHRAADS